MSNNKANKEEDFNIGLGEFEMGDDEDLAKKEEVANKPAKVLQYTGVQSAGFKDMLLINELNRSIKECGFEHPSQVQQECIPFAILGKDIICQAVAGMGKTAVFVLAILHQIGNIKEDYVDGQALILCNTRELAHQIKKEFDRFTTYLPDIRKQVFIGGTPYQEDKKTIKKDGHPHIMIGTPGKILALIKNNDLKLDNLKHFVIDEVDKMLDEIDMRTQVQEIFKKQYRGDRQVMMFSATIKNKDTCRAFMNQPFELYVDSEAKLTLHGLSQFYVKLDDNQKIKKVIELLDQLDFNQVIIFVKSQQYAQVLNELIKKEAFPSVALHRGMKQEKALQIYEDFKQSKYRICVATDLIGRGIDIEKVNIVINFDMPPDADQYLHRVGRAGRFGTKGATISFISSEKDVEILDEIQSRFEVKVVVLPKVIDHSLYQNA